MCYPNSCAEFPARWIIRPAGNSFFQAAVDSHIWWPSLETSGLFHSWVTELSMHSSALDHPWLSWDSNRKTLLVLHAAMLFFFRSPLFEDRPPWTSPFIKNHSLPFCSLTLGGHDYRRISPILPNDGGDWLPIALLSRLLEPAQQEKRHQGYHVKTWAFWNNDEWTWRGLHVLSQHNKVLACRHPPRGA